MGEKAKSSTTTYTLIQIFCSMAMFVILAYAGLLKMGEEFWQLLQWWIAVGILGIAFYPLTAAVFRRFDDKGYLFSKAIGIAVTGWLMWVLSSLRILPFTTENCYLCLAVCAGCNYIGLLISRIVRRIRKRRGKKLSDARENTPSEQELSDTRKDASCGQKPSDARENAPSEQKPSDARKDASCGQKPSDMGKDAAYGQKPPDMQKDAARGQASSDTRKDAAYGQEPPDMQRDAAREREPEKVSRDIEEVVVKELEVKPARIKEIRIRQSASPKRSVHAGRGRAVEKTAREAGKARQAAGTDRENPAADGQAINMDRRNLAADRQAIAADSRNLAADGQAVDADRLYDSSAVDRPEGAAGTDGPEKTGGVHWERIVFLEMLFFMAFLIFMYIKGFNPKAYGTEKMMDYGFMASMDKTDYFPVEDFWFSGENLNYYYFGQYLMTFVTKLSFNTVSYGYNLALGMGFAFCLTLSYALVYQVMKAFIAHKRKKISGAVAHVAGAVAAVAVTLAGNGHYIVFGKLVPVLWDILQIPGEKPTYWFPNSTRYIGYIPDTRDKTIHEFPSYSFILGDLHAHVINITFVLTVMAILLEFLLERREGMARAAVQRRNGEKTSVSFFRETFRLPVFVIGFFIGIFMMSNYWDFPIYFVVSGAVILASNAILCGFDKRAVLLTALHAVIVLGMGSAAAYLFQKNFVPMANGILLSEAHTPLYQLAILWGLQFFVIIGYLVSLIAKERQRNRQSKKRFVLFLENLQVSDLFIVVLGLCAMGLVLTPELIYMSDIYSTDYKRSNTMFKLVYQAYIMFGLAMGYILTRFILLKETSRQRGYGIAGLAVLVWITGYFPTSVKAWFGDITNEELYRGLRADQYIYEEQPTDAAAILWLNESVTGRPVVLEANAKESYTIYNRVSVLTGMPTVLGWPTHEWLWHNNVAPVNARSADVQEIYTSQDTERVRMLLRQYRVEYIFIGTCEYEKYEGLGMNTETLKSLGEVVYEGYPDIYQRTVMIIKVR